MTPAQRDRLFRRFALTIPTGRRVTVKWRLHLHETQDRVTTGRPYLELRDVVYVDVAGNLVAIPKASVRSIESAEPTIKKDS